MQTDQIQTMLFAQADKETAATAKKALKTVADWRSGHQHSRVCTIPVSVAAGELLSQDGRRFAPEPGDTVQDVMNRLRCARVNVSLGTLMDIVEKAMVEHATPADRLRYVTDFVNKVGSLQTELDNLQAQISDVASNQS